MKNFPHLRVPLFLLAALLIGVSSVAQAQDSMQRWQSFDFSKTALKASDIAALPLEELRPYRAAAE